MARYDVDCLTCGVAEVYAPMTHDVLTCPTCGFEAPQKFTPLGVPNARIETTGEDSRDPERVRDGSAAFNMGLRGVETVVGQNENGTPKTAYRPVANSEVGSRRAVVERAKRQGLVPHESGQYRPLGR